MGSNLGKHFSIMLVVIILAELIVLRMAAPPWWFRTKTDSPQLIDNLVDRRRAIYNPRNDPEVGEKAPTLALWNANGQKVSVHSFHGRRMAVVFTDTCAN